MDTTPQQTPADSENKGIIAAKLDRRQDGSQPLVGAAERLAEWVFCARPHLESVFELLAFDGGKESLSRVFRDNTPMPFISSFFRSEGYSGYEYNLSPGIRAQIGIAPMMFGGFVVKKVFNSPHHNREVWEIFTNEGYLANSVDRFALNVLFVDLTEMDPNCPVVSHLYSYLQYQYDQANFGAAHSETVHCVERFLRAEFNSKTSRLSANRRLRDSAITVFWKKVLDKEKDPVLNWYERQKAISSLYQERNKIARVKARVHGFSRFKYRIPMAFLDFAYFFRRIILRPRSNFRGLLHRYTIGVLIWFFQTAKNNIGLSIAMAIYGPFTFYFITQPMNPHAMWAVGKVRASYLEAMASVDALINGAEQARVESPVPPNPNETSAPAQPSNGTVEKAPSGPTAAQEVEKLLSTTKTAHLNFPLSTDLPPVDEQEWADRMSNFKAMQIGYEENLIAASRFGRVEQIESQLVFPLTVESSWMEGIRYLEVLSRYLKKDDVSESVKEYLRHEVERTRRAQLYLWDRLLRFCLDNPYEVMDESKEHVYKNYYLGRAMFLFQEMTLHLTRSYENFKAPAQVQKIQRLAKEFKKEYKKGRTVLERLKKNTKLFQQKDRFDGQELRGYMKRQWEIMYLLQNKTQEASHFGQTMYAASVRYAIWALQGITSAKQRELQIVLGKQGNLSEITESLEPTYEHLFYLMNLEYVSIQPEVSARLAKDVDSKQRRLIIEDVEAFLKERENILTPLEKP